MIEIKGNLFNPSSYMYDNSHAGPRDVPPDAVCITTNGFIKSNGEAVMGRGCAKQANDRWPGLSLDLAHLMKTNGNVTQKIDTVPLDGRRIPLIAFPVKPITEPYNGTNVVRHMRNQFAHRMSVGISKVPGWACLANIPLIRKSAKELVELTDSQAWEMVVLPRPGCGAGELSWEDVKPILEEILDNRFYCITY